MIAKVLLRSAAVASLLLAMGCASTIGNRSDLSDVTFTVGSTHKNDVANTLGFPQNRVVEDGIEYWGYRDKPELTGLVYAIPTSSTTATMYQAYKTSNAPLKMDSVAVIYAFDDNGTLVDIHQTVEN